MVDTQSNKKTNPTTPERIPEPKLLTYSELSAKDIPDIEYLVEPLIPKSALVYCYGPPGSFKSNFMLYTSIVGTKNDNLLEQFKIKKPFKTLYIDEENREIGMKDKLNKLSIGLAIEPTKNNYAWISSGFKLIDTTSLIQLEEIIKNKKIDLVIIDSVAKVFTLNERDETFVKLIYKALEPLMSKYGVTFVLIHHTRKLGLNQTKRGMEDISGSREFSAHADSMIYIESNDKRGSFTLKQTKNRYSDKCYSLNFTVTGDVNSMVVENPIRIVDEYKEKYIQNSKQILLWVESKNLKEFKRKECIKAMKEIGISPSYVDKTLKYMVKEEILDNKQKFGFYMVVK